ncbi:MAG: FAD-dependent oxidoreductase [Chloroflexi bacterium]|nr:FAD-dependent oxidoreductase [Chloroflexota bacterium]
MAHDVLIIGAGLIGAAIARDLAGAGLSVALIDRDRPGAGASTAAFGILQTEARPHAPAQLLRFHQAALAGYPDFVAAINDETGLTVEFRTEGRLLVALTEAVEAAWAAYVADQQAAGIAVEPLTAAAALALEPDLTPAVRSGVYLPHQRLVDNIQLTQAVALAATRRGVELVTGQPITSLLVEGDRVTGALVAGEPWRAGVVVNAAGCWSGRLDPRFPAPVVPVRGQGVALDDTPPRLRHVVYSGRCSLTPRADGRLLIGTTTEPGVGYAATPTAAGVGELLTAAIELAPRLAARPVLRAWAGLRPVTPDGLPIVGPSTRAAGLLWATGHGGMGILLAPVTAAIVAAMVLGQPSPIDAAPLTPARFDPAA